MKAVVCKEHGPPEKLVLEETQSRPLADGELRVAIHAAGVNFPDTLIIQNLYQFKPELPFTPGGEFTGVVTEVADDVTTHSVGDRVVCMQLTGGFADEAVLPAASCMPVPGGLDMVTAAGVTMTYGTSLYALKNRAKLQPGETLLVLGAAGGVGIAAVELGKLMGARVIAAAGSDEKLAFCRERGADEVINYDSEDLKQRTKDLTGGKGADVIYDAVGGDYFDKAIRAINWEGRMLIIGFASGRIPELPVNLALLKGCQVVGVFWGSFTMREPEANAANMAQLGEWYSSGALNPHVCEQVPLERAGEALRMILDRKARGKVVLVTDNIEAA